MASKLLEVKLPHKLIKEVAAAILSKDDRGKIINSLFDKLLYDEVEKLDMQEDFEIAVYAPDIHKLMDAVTRYLITLVSSQKLKQILWSALQEERQTKGRLTLSKERIEEIRASLDKVSSEEDNIVGQELVEIEGYMDLMDETEKNLKHAVEESYHKIYYDYTATLVLQNGERAIHNKQFLEEQLKRVEQLEKVVTRPVIIERMLSEMPNVRSELKEISLIPPGIARSMPLGMQGADILRVLQRAERVGNYFLEQLTKQSATTQVAGKS